MIIVVQGSSSMAIDVELASRYFSFILYQNRLADHRVKSWGAWEYSHPKSLVLQFVFLGLRNQWDLDTYLSTIFFITWNICSKVGCSQKLQGQVSTQLRAKWRPVCCYTEIHWGGSFSVGSSDSGTRWGCLEPSLGETENPWWCGWDTIIHHWKHWVHAEKGKSTSQTRMFYWWFQHFIHAWQGFFWKGE